MALPQPTAALAAVAGALAAATPTPEPTAATGPGIAGFLVTFALVVACIPLFLSMTRKIRGVRYRDQSEPGEPGPDGPDGPGGADRPGPAAAPRP